MTYVLDMHLKALCLENHLISYKDLILVGILVYPQALKG